MPIMRRDRDFPVPAKAQVTLGTARRIALLTGEHNLEHRGSPAPLATGSDDRGQAPTIFVAFPGVILPITATTGTRQFLQHLSDRASVASAARTAATPARLRISKEPLAGIICTVPFDDWFGAREVVSRPARDAVLGDQVEDLRAEAGTSSATISALTPLARHIEAR